MSRIVLPNGQHAGQAPQVALLGQVNMTVETKAGPQCPVLEITVVAETVPVPLPPPLAIQIGVSLIQLAAQYVQRPPAAPQPGPAEDLLAESILKVGGA